MNNRPGRPQVIFHLLPPCPWVEVLDLAPWGLRPFAHSPFPPHALQVPAAVVVVVQKRPAPDGLSVQKAPVDLLDSHFRHGRAGEGHLGLLVVIRLVEEDFAELDVGHHLQKVVVQVLQLDLRVDVVHEDGGRQGLLLLHVRRVVRPHFHRGAPEDGLVQLLDCVLSLLRTPELHHGLPVHPRLVPQQVHEEHVPCLLEVLLHVLPQQRRVQEVHEDLLLHVLVRHRLLVQFAEVVLPDLYLPPLEGRVVQVRDGAPSVLGPREHGGGEPSGLPRSVHQGVLDPNRLQLTLPFQKFFQVVLGRPIRQVRHEYAPVVAAVRLRPPCTLCLQGLDTDALLVDKSRALAPQTLA
mmetsp:Transcript_13851/g.39058  ORF Transcript_13851/g.39058 Transcript_13851/m.39058 type:complete len:351 (+) Transcript_13851:2360-3412(+)